MKNKPKISVIMAAYNTEKYIAESIESILNQTYKDFEFIKADVESLPFSDGWFDLIYSAYVLEHLENPDRVINEAIRVLKAGGRLFFVAPNFGAPNRASPPSRGSRIGKLLKDFVLDFRPASANRLDWQKISSLDDEGNYIPDSDTKVEPYLGSLLRYLKSKGLKVEYFSSCWSEELPEAKMLQRVIRVPGEVGIYPFNLWGPHLLAVFRKI